jgi:hypothetical protein
MKIEIIGSLARKPRDGSKWDWDWIIPAMTENESDIVLSTDSYVLQHRNPVQKHQLLNPLSENNAIIATLDGQWFYQKHIFDVQGSSGLSRSDLQVRVKHKLYTSSAQLAESMQRTGTDRILNKREQMQMETARMREQMQMETERMQEQMQMETERIAQEVRDFEISGKVPVISQEKVPVISQESGGPEHQRRVIPKSVRLYVWQRDGGKCAQCGSRESLEFDHIIPVSKGGSNTERNLQILCETCNRKKSANIE